MKPPVTASIWTPAPAALAVARFVDVAAMREWWGVSRGLVEPRPGGVWALAWEPSPQGYRYVSTGVVARYEPGRELAIEKLLYFHPERSIIGPMRLGVTATAEGDGCRLTVRQDDYAEGDDWDWYHAAVTEGWPAALQLLEKHLLRRR